MAILLLNAGVLWAWYGDGHTAATDLAVTWVHSRMTPFFGEVAKTISHSSVDPDVFKFESDCDALYRTEYPDHFFDLEYFTAASLPKDRQAFVSWCLNHHLWFSNVGTLPYVVTEWTYRLAAALAEHRRWPKDPAIQAKCLVYAGLLAHYGQDMCMPLHATIDYDGRATANGDSPHTGIHAKVDALLAKVTLLESKQVDPNSLAPIQDVLAVCLDQVRESHGQVDRIYALEQDLPDANAPLRPGSAVEAFAQDRLRITSEFTARLFLTAWQKSLSVEIPEWHSRTPQP
jgi:hypothetical protein